MKTKKQKKYIKKAIRKFHEAGGPSDAHLLPEKQPWHMAAPWCFCMPENIDENPLTGHILWVHRVIVH